LRRHVGAQAHIGKHIKPFNIIGSAFFTAGKNHPACAKTCRAPCFGKTVKTDRKKIRRNRRHGNVNRIVISNAAVYFIGVYD
jgi:hypothetical protein